MNASDIIKARQNKTLFEAYYRPTIFPGINKLGVSTLIKSTINYCPVSSVSTGGVFISSIISCTSLSYKYKCFPPAIDYQLANDINQGKYVIGFPGCSTLTNCATGETTTTGTCECKISYVTWNNTNPTRLYNYSTATYSSVTKQNTFVLTGQTPVICPLVDFYQGTNFASKCGNCNTILGGNSACCGDCS